MALMELDVLEVKRICAAASGCAKVKAEASDSIRLDHYRHPWTHHLDKRRPFPSLCPCAFRTVVQMTTATEMNRYHRCQCL